MEGATVSDPERRLTFESPRHARRSEALQALLQQPDVLGLLPAIGEPLPDDVQRWLGQLLLLYGLPFNNLVADSRMLPPESIRFFFLDRNWLDTLFDGALSVAQLSAPDSVTLEALRAAIRQAAYDAARGEHQRRRLLRRAAFAPEGVRLAQAAASRSEAEMTAVPPDECSPDGASPESSEPGEDQSVVWTGFLLRSSVVADWPGLEISAYADADRGQRLDLLRIERLAPTVLLAIVAGIPREVDVARPTQALHFGVERDPGTGEGPDGPAYRVFLRSIGDLPGHGGHPAGKQLPGDPAVEVPFRPDGQRRVLDLAALQQRIQAGLGAAYAPDPAPPVTSGAFAIQMMVGSERQRFAIQPSGVGDAEPRTGAPE
jgi:hypothetical protein